jgi:ABC-type amino acid transport system permease subunit
MDFYPWVVIAHVFFVIIAFAAHGTSTFAMFQARREADRSRLAAVLDLSQASLGIAGVALILGLVLGIVAAIMGGHFGRLWPWAAIGVVVIVFGVMTPVGANPMSDLRKWLGLPGRGDKPGHPSRAPGSNADVAAAQARLRPDLLSIIGVAAIAILVWLMEAKPF